MEAKKQRLKEVIEEAIKSMNVSVDEWLRDVKECRNTSFGNG